MRKKNGYFRADKILRSISRSLKEELSIDSYGKNLMKVPVFNNNFSVQFLNKFTSYIFESTFPPNDTIVNKNIFFFNNFFFICRKLMIKIYVFL